MTFQLLAKTINGRTFVLEVEPSDTVKKLKQMIEDADGIPWQAQRLVFGGKQMEDPRTLSDYQLAEGYCVHVILRLKGGRGDCA